MSDQEPRHARPFSTAARRATWLLVAALFGAAVATQAHRLVPDGAATRNVAPQSVSSQPPAPPGPGSPLRENASTRDALRTAFLTDLLQSRADALVRGDRAAWLKDVDPRRLDAAGDRFARLARVPWIAAHYRVLGEAPRPSAILRKTWGQNIWSADVELAYRLPGDTRDVKRRRVVTIRPEGQNWTLLSDLPGEGPRDLWDLTDIRIRKGDRALVIASAGEADLRDYARDVDRAARTVDRYWGGDWTRSLTVIVPGDTRSMARLLGRDSVQGLDQIAAVTTGELDRLAKPGAEEGAPSARPATADRIVLNPAAFADFSSPERRIVLTHEATHVAVRATSRTSTPVWLEEGFADYVAYSGSGLTRQSIAADLFTKIRGGWQLRHLPEEPEFDPARGDVAPAYAAAWLALDHLAARYGRDGVVRFARIANGLDPAAAGSGTAGSGAAGETPLARAFAVVTGADQAAFEAAWVTAVTESARGS